MRGLQAWGAAPGGGCQGQGVPRAQGRRRLHRGAARPPADSREGPRLGKQAAALAASPRGAGRHASDAALGRRHKGATGLGAEPGGVGSRTAQPSPPFRGGPRPRRSLLLFHERQVHGALGRGRGHAPIVPGGGLGLREMKELPLSFPVKFGSGRWGWGPGDGVPVGRERAGSGASGPRVSRHLPGVGIPLRSGGT